MKTMPGLSTWWRKKGWDTSMVLKEAKVGESVEAIKEALEALESKNLGIEEQERGKMKNSKRKQFYALIPYEIWMIERMISLIRN